MNGGSLLDRLCRPRVRIAALACLVMALGALYARFALQASFNHDEVEHAHVGFRIAQGLLPYRDFYQNHPPAYWLLTTRLVRACPFSINVIFLGRAVNILALAGCWLLGFRLLARAPGGRTWFSRLIYTWAVIGIAYRCEFLLARPDPIMTLLGTAAICLIPARGAISNRRAFVLGLLAGLAISVSPKLGAMVLVVPAVVIVHSLRDRQPRAAVAIPFYALGSLLALLPTFLWVWHHGLLEAFRFDVLSLNFALSKPWHHTFQFLQNPLYIPSVLGVLGWLSIDRRRRSGTNALLVVVLWFAAGVALAFMARHRNPYNMQMMAIPIAVGTACLATMLWIRTRGIGTRILLLGALLGYPTAFVAYSLVRVADYGGIWPSRSRKLIELAESGNRTCTAFSPWHPIFCRDVSGLSNEWDALFPALVSDPAQRERFRALWKEGLERTVAERPDLIVRRGTIDIWKLAVDSRALTAAELARLDALESDYDVMHFDDAEVWVLRRD